jgi:flagellar motor switch protein FliN/FliY
MGDMQQRLAALVQEVAGAAGSLIGAAPEVAAGSAEIGQGWVATLAMDGDAAAGCTLAFDPAGAASLAALASGQPEPIEDATVADLLRTVVAQAAAAMGARPANERMDLSLITLEPGAVDAGGQREVWAVSLPGLAAPLVVMTKSAAAPRDDVAARAAADDRLGSRIDVILDIDLPVVVRFGRTELPIRALSRIGPGSVIDLGRSPDDPVEILVSDRVVARGEVVIVGGNYGVRILDVTSQSERARSMEA